MRTEWRRGAVLAGAILVYFLIFPGDLAGWLVPVEPLLKLTGLISPWLYGLLAVVLVSWTVVRVWGHRPSLVVGETPR